MKNHYEHRRDAELVRDALAPLRAAEPPYGLLDRITDDVAQPATSEATPFTRSSWLPRVAAGFIGFLAVSSAIAPSEQPRAREAEALAQFARAGRALGTGGALSPVPEWTLLRHLTEASR